MLFYQTFILKNEDIYLFHRGIKTVGKEVSLWNNDMHVFIQIDSHNTIKSTFYEPDAIMRSKILNVAPIKTLSYFKDNIYFNYPFCDTIFRIEDKKLIPHFYIDFGRNKIPNNFFADNTDITKVGERIQNKKCMFLMDDYSVTLNGLHYSFSDYEHNRYIAFYNKESDRTLIGHHIVDDMFFVGKRYKMKLWQQPRLVNNEYLIWSIDSSKAKKMYEDYKKDPDKWKEFEAKYGQYIPQFEKIEPEDNSVLFKVKLKSYI